MVQLSKCSKFWTDGTPSLIKVTTVAKIQILRMIQLKYKYVKYNDTSVQTVVNSELLVHHL